MKIHLVRHAHAVPRDEWRGHDLLRPLCERGRVEAEALAQLLADEPIARIVAGPTLRCQQTLEPLAVAKDVEVEVEERLGRDEDAARALELLPAVDEGPVVFCSHAEIIVPLLQVLELGDAERDARVPCKKGSIWTLEGAGYTPSRASYREPVRQSKRRRHVEYRARELWRPRSRRLAVLDLGSTSFTLLIADVRRDGEIRPVVREKVMLRLGALINGDRVIPRAACEGAVQVARELQEVATLGKADRLIPVATAAVRDARNGRELAVAISEALEEPVRILSGEEEARAIFRAFQHRMALGDDPVLGLDLGGGSLELAVGSTHGVATEATLPLGVVRLHGELVHSDPMTTGEVERVRKRVRSQLAPRRKALLRHRPTEVIATGGTVRALARLVVEKRPGPHSETRGAVRVPMESLRQLTKDLTRSSHDERLAMRGIRRRRADLLPTGAVVLETIADELGMTELEICDWGLREGVLLDALSKRGR